MHHYTERIALEQFNFVNVGADTIQELREAADKVRSVYADRLHKPTAPAPYKSDKPFSEGIQMQESGMTCDKCGSVMNLQQKISKKNNKPYSAYFCPNSSAQDSHPIKFPPNKFSR